MTATEWLTIMAIDAAALLVWLAGETLFDAFRRELHADDIRRIAADSKTYPRGSAAGRHSVETRPAPGRHETPLGAGTETLPRPASASPFGRRGPRTPDRRPSPPLCGSGGPGPDSRPGSAPPDLALVGVAPHPRGEDVGAASPDLVAPTRGVA